MKQKLRAEEHTQAQFTINNTHNSVIVPTGGGGGGAKVLTINNQMQWNCTINCKKFGEHSSVKFKKSGQFTTAFKV